MVSILRHRAGRITAVTLALLILTVIQAQTAFLLDPKPPKNSLFLGIPYFSIIYNMLWAGLYFFIDCLGLTLIGKRKKVVFTFQFIAGIAISLLHITIVYLILKLFASAGWYLFWPDKIIFKKLFLDFINYNFMFYALLAGFVYIRELYIQAQEKNLKAIELENQLSKAHLLSLKMQLHPHFLFNALNTISGYINEDREKAVDIIALLSDLLRDSLSDHYSPEIPLRQEMDFIFKYLEIERLRFSDRLEIRREIDPEANACLIPPMLLQPIVENAVRHGIANSIKTGIITIGAETRNNKLFIFISDNGPGFPPALDNIENSGIGLRNTRERLERMYGSSHDFSIHSSPGIGVKVRIVLPCKYTEADKPNPEETK